LIVVGFIVVALAPCGDAAAAQQAQQQNIVSGSASATGTAATSLIAAPAQNRRLCISSLQCGRTDAGTSAIRVTLNDDGTTVIVLPNSGGGGSVAPVFSSPLTVPSATALTFTASASTSTVYCSAQGFSGN
jgi:hypothetical protein